MISRDTLLARGADPDAAFAFAAEPGAAFTPVTDGPALAPASGATHGHPPDTEGVHTGLVAWGAGVRRDTDIGSLRLIDVAPLVGALGLQFTPDSHARSPAREIVARPASPHSDTPSSAGR